MSGPLPVSNLHCDRPASDTWQAWQNLSPQQARFPGYQSPTDQPHFEEQIAHGQYSLSERRAVAQWKGGGPGQRDAQGNTISAGGNQYQDHIAKQATGKANPYAQAWANWEAKQQELEQGAAGLNTAAIAGRQAEMISRFQSPEGRSLDHQPWNPRHEEVKRRQQGSRPQLGMISNLDPGDQSVYLNQTFPTR